MVHKRLGEILIEKRLITEAQLKECLEEQRQTREYLGLILARKKFISEEQLLKALSDQFGIPCVSVATTYIDWDLARRFSSIILTDQKIFPFRQDDACVTAAVSDPLDAMAIVKLEEAVQPKGLKLVLVSLGELKELIQECKKRSRGSLKALLEEDGGHAQQG